MNSLRVPAVPAAFRRGRPDRGRRAPARPARRPGRHRRKHRLWPIVEAELSGPEIEPAPDAASASRDVAAPVRGGRRSEVVLVRLLPVPRPRLDELDSGREPGRDRRRLTDRAVGAQADRRTGRPAGRLGQPRPARGLRAARLLEGPGAGRRHAGLVHRLLRRVRRARGKGVARRSLTARSPSPVSTARRRWRRIRSTRAAGASGRGRLPRHSRDVRAAGFAGRRATAVERDESGPADRPNVALTHRSRTAASTIAFFARPRAAKRPSDRSDLPTSSVAVRPSSSVRVDIAFAARVDCRPARKSRAQIPSRGGGKDDDEVAPPPMRCAQRRPGIREICAHLELDRRRQDRLPDEPEPWARSGPRLF